MPEMFDHVQIDPPLIHVPLVPERRMEKGLLKSGTKTSLLKVHAVDIIVGRNSPSSLENIKSSLVVST